MTSEGKAFPIGTETSSVSIEKCQNAIASGENAAHFPPDLAEVIAAWPELPEGVKASIVELVKGARQ